MPDSTDNKQSPNWGYWTLGITAMLALFCGLGHYALWGSEDRWAEIAREMILNKDYLHPAINGEVYFDKPLLSYWLIVAISFFCNCLNEFVARAPSALAGLVGIFSTVYIGKKLFNRKTGITAGWILLSSFGFLFWDVLLQRIWKIWRLFLWLWHGFYHEKRKRDFSLSSVLFDLFSWSND